MKQHPKPPKAPSFPDDQRSIPSVGLNLKAINNALREEQERISELYNLACDEYEAAHDKYAADLIEMYGPNWLENPDFLTNEYGPNWEANPDYLRATGITKTGKMVWWERWKDRLVFWRKNN